MLNAVCHSQILGLVTVDSSTSSHLGKVEDVWVDRSGKVAYLSGCGGYLPLTQVAEVSTFGIAIAGSLLPESPANLYQLNHRVLQSRAGECLGWVEDFLFNWQSGEILSYVLSGDIARPFGGQTVVTAEEMQELAVLGIGIRTGASPHGLKQSQGYWEFWRGLSQTVVDCLERMSNYLQGRISLQNPPATDSNNSASN